MERTRTWPLLLSLALIPAGTVLAQAPGRPERPARPGQPARPMPAPGTPRPAGVPPLGRAPEGAPSGAAAGAQTPARTPSNDPMEERIASRSDGVRKRVLALYYPWYGTPERSGKWLHQDEVDVARRTIGSHAHFPAAGPYDSTDPAVIDRHLQQAKAAGIETLVCSWWGRNDATDKAIRALLPRASAASLTVSILWERPSEPGDAAATLAELSYLLDSFGKQPAYLREGGKPVVFLYGPVCRSLPVEEWASLLSQAGRRYPPGVFTVAQGERLDDLVLWDGLFAPLPLSRMAERTPAVCARLQHEAGRVPALLSKQLGRMTVTTVMPGYDDRRQFASQRQRVGTQIERLDGALYGALGEQAVKDNPHWLLINSFNQWHSGTEIEPSVEHGDRYLALTRDLAARFKAATPAAQK